MDIPKRVKVAGALSLLVAACDAGGMAARPGPFDGGSGLSSPVAPVDDAEVGDGTSRIVGTDSGTDSAIDAGMISNDAGATTESFDATYAIDPPDPCSNQFFVDGCETGDAASTCGGVCAVANACSPPEDPSKASDRMTFACPRYMLFSDEMTAAAHDDALVYGWGDAASPPFNYGVVGHDPDTGGLDSESSTCCQCYELVFDTPQYGPTDAPVPKPMVVQSFNTQAGGGKNFDLFMGVGGFGAFNACVPDPSFANTTTFGHFLYTSFPTDDPETGGASFLNQDACMTNGTTTYASVSSSACQSAIASECGGIAGNAAGITSDTVNSCIQGNAPGALYHQNWNILVKKVSCPTALTRVTGCELADAGLPPPDPSATNSSTAGSAFASGYTTTTMQDCCKPSCAWQDYVGGTDGNLPVVAPWTSFYSCDESGVPITVAP